MDVHLSTETMTKDTAAAVVETAEHAEGVSGETEVIKTETVVEADTETVEKAETTAEADSETMQAEEVEKATDPMAEVRSQIASLTNQLADVSRVISELMTKMQQHEAADADVAKAQEAGDVGEQVTTDAPMETVQRSTSTDAGNANAEAIAGVTVEALASVVKQVVGEAMKSLEARMEAIEQMPVDKSLAVSKAKGEQESVLSLYEQQVGANVDGRDALRIALEYAFQQR